jgi:hypothetical protein
MEWRSAIATSPGRPDYTRCTHPSPLLSATVLFWPTKKPRSSEGIGALVLWDNVFRGGGLVRVAGFRDRSAGARLSLNCPRPVSVLRLLPSTPVVLLLGQVVVLARLVDRLRRWFALLLRFESRWGRQLSRLLPKVARLRRQLGDLADVSWAGAGAKVPTEPGRPPSVFRDPAQAGRGPQDSTTGSSSSHCPRWTVVPGLRRRTRRIQSD